MKLYFAKYLPIEGEIDFTEIGSPIWYNGHVRFLVADAILSSPIHGCVTRFDYYKKVKAQPAKLFLCSRDIQVGDMLYPPIEEGYDPTKPMLCIKDGIEPPENVPIVRISWAIEGKWYKIIGEISPEATWVKEGDEFTDEDIQAWFCDKHGSFKLTEGHHPKNNNYKGWLTFFKIKGPCGHFH